MAAAQRVFVTGATGLLGSHVVERLGRAGGRIVALVRRSSPHVAWLRSLDHVDLVEGDLRQPESYAQALQSCTGVIHCAGIVGEAYQDGMFEQVNVVAFKALLDLVRMVPSITRTVYVSTLGVYPLRDHYGSDEETRVAVSGFDAYTNSKIAAERIAHQFAEDEGMALITLRPGFIYGARDRTVLPKLIRFMKSGFFIYVDDKTKLLDNTYVENAAHACVLALTRPALQAGVFNITDDPVVSKEAFIQEIAKHTNLQSHYWTLPNAMGRMLASATANCPDWIASVVPPLSWERYKFLGLNLEFSIAKAKRELGYEPVCGFEEGMARSIAWFRKEGLL